MLHRRSRSARNADSPASTVSRIWVSSVSATLAPGAISVVTAASLGSRAIGPLVSSPGRAPHRDPTPGWSESVPARAGDQGRGRNRPAAHLVRQARARAARPGSALRDGPSLRPARAGRLARGVDSTAAACAPGWRRGGRRRASVVRPGPLDRRLAVVARRPRDGDRGDGPRARRAGHSGAGNRSADAAPGPPGRTGARARRRGNRPRAELDPRRRPTAADRLDQRHERQDHHRPG